ncbi:hypothetical protein Tco_0956524, partial [Tanacetum coccineum]
TGYIKDHKKTVINGQAQTRESEEYKAKVNNSQASGKSKLKGTEVNSSDEQHDGKVRKVISRPHSHSSHTSSMVEAQREVGFVLFSLSKQTQVSLKRICQLGNPCELTSDPTDIIKPPMIGEMKGGD